LQLLGDISNCDVLDLACGEGYYTRIIRKMVAPQNKVFGVDISEDMIELAKS